MKTSLGSTGLLLLGVAGLAVTVALFRALPRTTFVIWGVVLFFVPVWIGVTVGFFWAAITIVTLAAIAANLGRIHWSVPDTLIAAFTVLAVAAFLLKQTNFSAIVILILEWIVPYVWGRLVLNRISAGFIAKTIATLATVAAVLALTEFATGTNIFVLLPPLGPSFEVWGTLQMRGGFLRAEGAWGHSIALGAALALSVAFLLASSWRTIAKIAALAVITGAIVVTFSRIGLVSLVLTVGLSIVLQQRMSRGSKVAVMVGAIVAAIVVVPFVSSVFLEAGTEAGNSATYRTDLFALVGQLSWFGASTNWDNLSADGTYLGTYANSVDNALLVVALRFGIIPTLFLVLLLALAIISLFLPGRANTATIAIVAQIPAFFSVAFITQYGMFVWFVGGLAVAMLHHRHEAAEREPAMVSGLDVARRAKVG